MIELRLRAETRTVFSASNRVAELAWDQSTKTSRPFATASVLRLHCWDPGWARGSMTSRRAIWWTIRPSGVYSTTMSPRSGRTVGSGNGSGGQAGSANPRTVRTSWLRDRKFPSGRG